MHGARGGGPTGKRNGNYRSGAFAKETMEAVALLKTIARLVRRNVNGNEVSRVGGEPL
jgi:hypothetical protein